MVASSSPSRKTAWSGIGGEGEDVTVDESPCEEEGSKDEEKEKKD